jgi:hypothetical protein
VYVSLYIKNSDVPVERTYVCTPVGLGILCERVENDHRVVRIEVEVEE